MRIGWAIRGAGVILIGVVGFAGYARATQDAGWREAGPLPFPATVAVVGGLKLILDGHPRDPIYRVECVTLGGPRSVQIEVQTGPGSGPVGGGHVDTIDHLTCEASGETIGTGSLTELQAMKTGDSATISIHVSTVPPLEGPAKTVMIYMMGTDRQLRLGVGSVWKR